MRIVIVTDAWHPQINGVVATLAHTATWLRRFGHDVEMITPSGFPSLPCPTYPEIRLSLLPYSTIARRIEAFAPDAVHVATEGPLGLAARRFCTGRRWRFTTSYHTRFPQYLRARFPVPERLSYAALRRFHAPARCCMVSTESVRSELAARGFRNLAIWRRGVDTELFRPGDKTALALPRPIAAYVGRVAVEKNVGAFLAMPWHGSKVVIGDGPARAPLQREHPGAHFLGFRVGEDLARLLAATDVMVFPSRTDTFGLVNLEAAACGVPVAAYPVTGPIDVIEDGVSGALDPDLAVAARRALDLDPQACRRRALQFDWARCSREFVANLAPNGGERAAPAPAPCVSRS